MSAVWRRSPCRRDRRADQGCGPSTSPVGSNRRSAARWPRTDVAGRDPMDKLQVNDTIRISRAESSRKQDKSGPPRSTRQSDRAFERSLLLEVVAGHDNSEKEPEKGHAKCESCERHHEQVLIP